MSPFHLYNLKWTKIRSMLAKHGLCWNSKEKVEAFCCHPSNRGGVMLSPHDVHAKGSAIISLGADMAKIQSSVAFEMATEPLQKAKQLQANRDLVSASQGKLANISGQERYLTCGSSHLTAFCRAVQAQCTTEDEQCRPCLDQKPTSLCHHQPGIPDQDLLHQ